MFLPGLATFQKKEQAGAPFVAGSADNGLSVNPTNGKIELGEDRFGYTGAANFLSGRAINTQGFILRFFSDNGSSSYEILNSQFFLIGDVLDTGNPVAFQLSDAQIGELNFLMNSSNIAAVLSVNPGSGFLNMYQGDGTFRFTNTADEISNGRLVQINGNMSLGTDVTFAIDFPNTSAQSSSDISSALFIGALPGDAVLLGVDPASVLPNSSFTAWVSAADTVTVRFNNYSAAAQNPPAGNFKISVIKLT